MATEAGIIDSIQRDKKDLVRLLWGLSEAIVENHTRHFPRQSSEMVESIEQQIRTIAFGLVFRLDQAQASSGSAQIPTLIRSSLALLRHIVAQMQPDSLDRFLIQFLCHHLECLQGKTGYPAQNASLLEKSPRRYQSVR